ncbi:MAG: hypothetical protein A3F84_23545 [Candidatus Handelsmanbacteria bacterium RIFCSPLOWO2_12_FULL_64_10]|uniref:Uncharacterized protein n=1 Tax=Handelsmanbacteria sp. (strain RIFCSPLOWO2_12_FULL_64_10) TaxID=1817868 RepID=A0A1F6CRF3_HANXR|nr:MAG: hypothetical protein A3F84_23545 [Candidatus Handelsmanbacteria bacterium RIFCSPLOWO2_12_FULL_64_10]
MPWEDPIVEEVRKARDAYAKRFNYDLDAIYRDLKEKERKSGRVVVPCPTREVAGNSSEEVRAGESA